MTFQEARTWTVENLSFADNSFWILVILACLIAVTMYSFHRNPERKLFDLTDLIMDKGKVNDLKTYLAGAFVLSCWLMINLAYNGKMTEGYFTIFVAAWIAPILTKIVKGSSSVDNTLNPPQPPKDGEEKK